ncbi:hypothetical protein BT96DRAFT_788897, partial [Gymnopus androsaceus JB14]
TQLYRFLCQLSYGPTHCTFVYDGDARAIMKRGIKVVKKEPVLYQKSKALVKAFGFSVQMALGDAEAELAVMNKLGVIDAVLTKDSDVFPLGAQSVFKVVPWVIPSVICGRRSAYILNSEACSDSRLVVDIYNADDIKATLGLT